jgi:hypothetical protein
VAGAAIGYTSGLAVVRRGRAKADDSSGAKVEGVLSRLSISPASRGGFTLGFSAR